MPITLLFSLRLSLSPSSLIFFLFIIIIIDTSSSSSVFFLKSDLSFLHFSSFLCCYRQKASEPNDFFSLFFVPPFKECIYTAMYFFSFSFSSFYSLSFDSCIFKHTISAYIYTLYFFRLSLLALLKDSKTQHVPRYMHACTTLNIVCFLHSLSRYTYFFPYLYTHLCI